MKKNSVLNEYNKNCNVTVAGSSFILMLVISKSVELFFIESGKTTKDLYIEC